ncbi:iron complex outermembrane receptor protein [Natronocella acetinitrilica]|uniref:Iron complex outermembrane receptor protein n=1 Tax=Natronocella acetinitrilica TaxID=414046 RepID=A0AAE3G6C5_9GAMM|nr:TonB-dependent receptor [Natronocella acetinitrilica]MCP1676217.1 iron complex outermembrane receptor protein [Natronocella acetinitrilica]
MVMAESLTLEPITVTAPRVERDITRTPQAVSVVQPEDIQDGRQGLQLDESLNRVPGVFMQNRYNFAQNLRVSIRGFGARAPFGVRGIRVFVDGIPETLPDGQSQLDAIDLESVDRIEVIRGPSSALYGNATGGVLDITTRDGPPTPYLELRGTAGSDNFRRYGVRGGGEQGPWNYHFSAWELAYDGFREQSETEKRLFNGKVRYDFDEHRSLTTVFTALDQPVGQDPGGLTRQQVRDNRRGANANAINLDAGQEVEQQRLGLIYEDRAVAGGTLRARTFYTQRDFRQQLPFPGQSLIKFERDFYGLGLDYSNAFSAGNTPVRYIVGVEVDEQRDDRERFGVNPQGEVTGQSQDERQKATAAGTFAQADIGLTDRLDWTVAGRVDRVRFRIDDRLQDGGDQSGSQSFTEVSAATGFSYQLLPAHAVYASVGTAYETPTFTEFAPPGGGGGFNPDLEPQRAVNAEVGIKGFLGDNTRYDLAVFSVRTRDEIVNVQTDPNVFGNAGRSRRYGLELGLEHFIGDNLSVSGAWTVSDFRFTDFEDADGTDFSGNRLPGLPKHALFGEIAWREPNGAYAIVDALVVSRVYANNANDENVGGYGLVNTRVGTVQRMGTSEVETFVGLNNVFDRDYFSNVRVNANNAQYYEPAPGRNVYAGVRARF